MELPPMCPLTKRKLVWLWCRRTDTSSKCSPRGPAKDRANWRVSAGCHRDSNRLVALGSSKFSLLQNVGDRIRSRASRKNKNKNKPLIQYQLCILTFSVYNYVHTANRTVSPVRIDVSAMILLDVKNKIAMLIYAPKSYHF